MGNESTKEKKEKIEVYNSTNNNVNEGTMRNINGIDIYNVTSFARPLSGCYEKFVSNIDVTHMVNKTEDINSEKHEKLIHEILKNINPKLIRPSSSMNGRYYARVVDMYDGDTMTILFLNDVGKPEIVKVRLYGSDTPELKGPDKSKGLEAKAEALRFIGAEGCIDKTGIPKKNGNETKSFFERNYVSIEIEFVDTPDKFGRMLGKVIKNGNLLSEHLVEKGLAKAYFGGTKEEFE